MKIVYDAIRYLANTYPDPVLDVCEAITRHTLQEWLELNADSGNFWLEEDIENAKEVRDACRVLLDYSKPWDGSDE